MLIDCFSYLDRSISRKAAFPLFPIAPATFPVVSEILFFCFAGPMTKCTIVIFFIYFLYFWIFCFSKENKRKIKILEFFFELESGLI